MRAVAIGDNCIDVYTNLGESYPGGGCVNFAVQARRAGLASGYVGVVGNDKRGAWLRAALAAEYVDTTHLVEAPGATAVAFVSLKEGERVFMGSKHGVREQLRVTPTINAYLAGFDLIHVTLDSRVDGEIMGWAGRGQRVSYDFSHRATPSQVALLPYVAVAFFSGQATPLDQAEARLAAYGQQACSCVVMTLGARGSLAWQGGHIWRQPALPTQVLDTLGAGDAFQAGFMAAYLQTGAVADALYAGARQAAVACRHLGGFGHGRPTDAAGEPREETE